MKVYLKVESVCIKQGCKQVKGQKSEYIAATCWVRAPIPHETMEGDWASRGLFTSVAMVSGLVCYMMNETGGRNCCALSFIV